MDAEAKTKAFRLYDFDSSQGWKDYLLRVDISGPGYNDKLLKLKAKWYRREVDSDFDVEWLKKYGMTSAEHKTSAAAEATTTEGASSAAGADHSTDPPLRQASQQPVPSLSLTLMHAAIFLFGVTSMLPLSSRTLHYGYLQVFVVTCFAKVLLQFGVPKFRPLTELKQWANRAFNTTDAQYGLMGLLFFRQVPTKIIFIPGIVLAAYHVMHYLNIRFAGRALWIRHGVPLYNRLSEKRNMALLLNAVAEIMTGLLLIVQLLAPTRNILVLVLYWHWLRIRYWSPDSAWMHRQAWSNIGRKVNPMLNRVPFVKGPHSLHSNLV